MPIDLSGTNWIFQGVWEITNGVLVPPVTINASYMVILVEAFFCSRKNSYVKQFVDSPVVGRIYVAPDGKVQVNKKTLLEVAQVVNVNLEIISDVGNEVSIWTSN